jgi:hypothetical protein
MLSSRHFFIIYTFFNISFILSFTELYVGIKYENEIECKTTLDLDTSSWFIVKSIFTILSISILLKSIIIKHRIYFYHQLFTAILHVFLFFNLIWVSFGLRILYDCPNMKPVPVITVMYIGVIMGYFSIFNLFYINYKFNKFRDNTVPLLDVYTIL